MRTLVISLLVTFALSSPLLSDVTVQDTVYLSSPENARAPWGIDTDLETGRVYVAGLEYPYRLAVLDPPTNQVIYNIQLSGLYPHGVCVYGDARRAFVANTGSANISVVDLNLLREVTTLPAGSSPVDLCLNFTTRLLYVANEYSNNVTVYDADSLNMLDTIAVGAGPYSICVNSVTNRIYVANLHEGSVSIIDGTSHTVVDTIFTDDYPTGICVNEQTGLVYVTLRDSNSVVIIDEHNDIQGTIPVGETPREIGADPVLNRIYVVNAGSRNVTVIDGMTNTIIDSVPVGREPVGGIAIDPFVSRVYVTNYASEDVTVIDGANCQAVGTIRLKYFAHETCVDPVAGNWFVTNSQGNNLSCFDIESNTELWDYLTRYSPGPLCSYDLAGRILVTHPDENRLIVLDSSTGALIDEISVGQHPEGVCVNSVTDKVYVTNKLDFTVSVIRATTGEHLATVTLGHEPYDVAIDESTNMVYVTAFMGMLYVIDGSSDSLVDSLYLHGFCEPDHIAINQAIGRLYITSFNCDILIVVNCQPLTIDTIIPLSDYPDEVAVNEIIGHTYACVGDTLVVIDENNSICESVSLGMHARGCSVLEDRGLIYVGCPEGGCVIVLSDDAISSIDTRRLPREVSIVELTPNPTFSEITLTLAIPRPSWAGIEMYDVRGRLISQVFNGHLEPGYKKLQWQHVDTSQRDLPPGIYFLVVRCGDQMLKRKIVKLQ